MNDSFYESNTCSRWLYFLHEPWAEFLHLLDTTLECMGNLFREVLDGEGPKNQSLLTMRGPEAYNFLVLVALEESDDERFRNQAKIMVKV